MLLHTVDTNTGSGVKISRGRSTQGIVRLSTESLKLLEKVWSAIDRIQGGRNLAVSSEDLT